MVKYGETFYRHCKILVPIYLVEEVKPYEVVEVRFIQVWANLPNISGMGYVIARAICIKGDNQYKGQNWMK